MKSAYEVLNNIGGFIKNADVLRTTTPRHTDEVRHDVKTATNRGGFIHYVYVPIGDSEKARLLLNVMDTKVTDHKITDTDGAISALLISMVHVFIMLTPRSRLDCPEAFMNN